MGFTRDDRRIHELVTLNAIGETLNRAVDLRSALEQALDTLVERLGLDTGWVFLARDDGVAETFYPAAGRALPPALADDDQAELRYQDCECQDLFLTGEFGHAVNIVHCSRLRGAKGDTQGLSHHASVPLVSRERVLGILNVATRGQSTFAPEDLQLLTAAGYQIGMAIERARLYDLLQARRYEEQNALLGLSNALLRAGDLQQILDEVTRVAAGVLGADASAIILESAEGRAQFRAAVGRAPGEISAESSAFYVEHGAAGPIVTAGQPDWGITFRTEHSPAGWVVSRGEPLALPDLAHDERWSHPLLAELEGFVSAAFVPLFRHESAFGVLGVYCRRPRLFSEEEVRLLTLMGNQAALAIEQEHLHQQALEEQRLRRELDLAREIQTSFLPDVCPLLPGWSICGYYQAARQVGGDFYDFVPLAPTATGTHPLGLVIADVADKGVPAALFMALVRTLVRATATAGRSPGAALRRTNEIILADTHTDLFVTIFYAALEPETGVLCAANAGHNPPLWWRAREGRVQRLPGSGMALGVLDPVILQEEQVVIEPGDMLLLYTDGVTEALNAAGEEFGEERLVQILAAQAGGSARDVQNAIVHAHETFIDGQAAFDDVTLVVLKREGVKG
jgi:sigma-B regulation protein RsbU (phosphoserine phosphatase)